MRRGAVIKIVPNRESFAAAHKMLGTLSENSELLEGVLEIPERTVDLGDLFAKLFRVETKCLPAGRTGDLSISLQPTDLLLGLLTAVGAGNV